MIHRTTLSFLTLLLFLPSLSRAQDGDLPGLLKQIQDNLQEVTTDKYRYDQQLDFDPATPYKVTIDVTETSTRNDRAESWSYEINLSDLDARRIQYDTDRDEQTVLLKTTRGQSMILLRDEDGDIKYVDEAKLWSNRIDDSKALRDVFKKAVPVATELFQAGFTPGTTLEALNTYLQSAIQPVDRDGDSWNVSYGVAGDYPDLVAVSITDDDDETTIYRFSLADLAANTLELDIATDELNLEVSTIGRKSLLLTEEPDGDRKYEDELSIPIGKLDEGRRILQSFEAALELARTERTARLPRPSSLEEALNQLADLLGEVGREDELITANLTPAVPTTLTVTTTETDGEEETARYLFDFGDLTATSVDMDARGSELNVSVRAKGREDYVQKWENDEPDGFEDALTFPVRDVETGHRVAALLPYLIEEAGKATIEAGSLSWLAEAVANGSDDETTYTLEAENDNCAWVVTAEEGGSRPSTVTYDFNLYDLNPQATSYEIDRDRAVLTLKTNRNEEIINVLEDDEPGYAKELSLPLGSLADAKKAVITLRALIESCPN